MGIDVYPGDVARPHFLPLHATQQRWIFVVAHRRAGKTVALVNHLIRAATTNERAGPASRYAYIGPTLMRRRTCVGLSEALHAGRTRGELS